jgi:hypothetical protein
MPEYWLWDLELGERAARALEDELLGWGALWALHYWYWCAAQPGFDGPQPPRVDA